VFIPAEGGRLNALRKDSRTEEWSYAAAKTMGAPPVLAREAQVLVESGDEEGGGEQVRTVVRDADFLYVSSEDGNVYRLNVYTGWKPPGGSGGYSWVGQTKARIVTSPVAYQQRVFAASLDFSLYAFESVDGAVAWKYHVGRFVREQPFAFRDSVFLIAEEEAGGPRTMYAVNSRSGSCRWQRRVAGAGGRAYEEDGLPGVGKMLAPGRELVYVLAQDTPEIWGVRIADGQVVHRVPLTEAPDFAVSHDAEHGREVNDVGLILMATADGRVLALKERRVYTK
jgi:outer membrane protein assembly factor BamB